MDDILIYPQRYKKESTLRSIVEDSKMGIRLRPGRNPLCKEIVEAVTLYKRVPLILDRELHQLIGKYKQAFDNTNRDSHTLAPEDCKTYSNLVYYLSLPGPSVPPLGIYSFVLEHGNWYIDLPEYISTGGNKADLQMVAGADSFLYQMAEGKNSVQIWMRLEPFEGADVIYLKQIADPITGGGYYSVPKFEGEEVNQEMWLCAVTEVVCGYLPESIYIRRVKPGEQVVNFPGVWI